MPRTKKADIPAAEEKEQIAKEVVKEVSEATENAPEADIPAAEEIPAKVLELMRLYPQYEKIWITPNGFVRPEGTPQYLLTGAKLYTNKFYKN